VVFLPLRRVASLLKQLTQFLHFLFDTVSGILTNLRRVGIKEEDAAIMNKVLALLADSRDETKFAADSNLGARKDPQSDSDGTDEKMICRTFKVGSTFYRSLYDHFCFKQYCSKSEHGNNY
jgi:hypothetical protein